MVSRFEMVICRHTKERKCTPCGLCNSECLEGNNNPGRDHIVRNLSPTDRVFTHKMKMIDAENRCQVMTTRQQHLIDLQQQLILDQEDMIHKQHTALVNNETIKGIRR